MFGKIFLSGNIENGDLENAKKQLNKLNIAYSISGNIILFDESEIPKLPTDKKGHYLPIDDDSGFTIYEINVELKRNEYK